MKFLTSPSKASFRVNWFSFGAWKSRVIKTAITMFLLWLLLPSVYYGIVDTISGIAKSVAYQRSYYHVKRKHGRTMADVWQTKNEWVSLGKSLANFEFLK